MVRWGVVVRYVMLPVMCRVCIVAAVAAIGFSSEILSGWEGVEGVCCISG